MTLDSPDTGARANGSFDDTVRLATEADLNTLKVTVILCVCSILCGRSCPSQMCPARNVIAVTFIRCTFLHLDTMAVLVPIFLLLFTRPAGNINPRRNSL